MILQNETDIKNTGMVLVRGFGSKMYKKRRRIIRHFLPFTQIIWAKNVRNRINLEWMVRQDEDRKWPCWKSEPTRPVRFQINDNLFSSTGATKHRTFVFECSTMFAIFWTLKCSMFECSPISKCSKVRNFGCSLIFECSDVQCSNVR